MGFSWLWVKITKSQGGPPFSGRIFVYQFLKNGYPKPGSPWLSFFIWVYKGTSQLLGFKRLSKNGFIRFPKKCVFVVVSSANVWVFTKLRPSLGRTQGFRIGRFVCRLWQGGFLYVNSGQMENLERPWHLNEIQRLITPMAKKQRN